jgi:hypothetical protein
MTEMLCLAYSRKHSARCVAGLRLDTLEWVRPVSGSEHGELSAASCRLDVGRPPRPLDVIQVPLTRAVPARHQPENWLVRDRQWKLVDELSVDSAANYLDDVIVTGPDLFGDTADSIDWDWIEVNGVPSSLALVRVRPTFFVNPWGSLRALFSLRRVSFDLAVTDLAPWTAVVRQQAPTKAKQDWYLTVSLGERYDKKNRAYKLVAGGIEDAR